MLSLGLTGGIAAGKSLLATRFRELGAVVIDADRLAREVLAPGTPGLSAVVERFGHEILKADGALDRPQLGSLVFADTEARESLNAIVHPLVRTAAERLKLDAGPDAVVVQDIPLLVETGQGPNFHLVVVVQAPREERISRMVRERGMTREEAQARMAAQASDDERAEVADVIIDNDGSPDQAIAALDALWHARLVPFAANLAARMPAAGPRLPDGDALAIGTAAAKRARLHARITRAVAGLDVSVESLPAGDGVSGQALRWGIRAGAAVTVQELLAALAGAGFFRRAGGMTGEQLLASADPACTAELRLL